MNLKAVSPLQMTLLCLLLLAMPLLASDARESLHKSELPQWPEAQQGSEQQQAYQQFLQVHPVQIMPDGTVLVGELQWMSCSLGQHWHDDGCEGGYVSYSSGEGNLARVFLVRGN